MRTLYRAAIFALGLAAPAGAQTLDNNGLLVLPDRSSIYNQNSVNLPSIAMPYGQDEIRGADGASCRTSVASSGPYVDFGMIGSNDLYDRQAASLYGRVVIPLGKKPERLDCTRLYDLEIQRLKTELEMAKMGLGMMTLPEQPATIADPE